MMRLLYYAVTAPVAVGSAWAVSAAGLVPVPVEIAVAGLVVTSSTWPALVQPRYKGRMHPAAALARGSAYVGYMVRTPADKDRGDLDRGPSYCLEWCALVGLAVALLALQIPPIAAWAWWFGGAVALGTAVHVLADWITPSGVPLSVVWNYLRHGEVWRRHSLNLSSSDTAGDKFLAVPVLFALTAVLILARVGWLGPLVGALFGWS